ncbi:HlyD family type I secretion periplasmic adaptor subunit [Motilimonas cestriensis]|uniref:Membrane fusion protein (MFP) family protein n=1 Tax=Motilimonas cestriensis TaxID=2742685 RepID=A0ABS8WGP9_9GAMM|nr:HlyD family type I secretion periplasmic adaptor subunit [Motilimonas cestriensis]MCE2596540.1 HlyD family type I secretion periplasmic adaptor subunit [Motilimonas cestriensis]
MDNLQNPKKLPNKHDVEFVDETSSASLLNTAFRARLLLWVMFLFFVSALVWAYFAELDEVTVGTGKIIPSSQVQVVQNLEGGILREIYIKEGDVVEQGQALMRIDDTKFRSDYREQEQNVFTLSSDIIRLKAEQQSVKVLKDNNVPWQEQVSIDMVELEYSEEFRQQHSMQISAETARYKQGIAGLNNQLLIMAQQIQQKEQELVEINSKVKHLQRAYGLVRKEINLTRPLAKEGVVSEVEIIQLERDLNNTASELESAKLSIPKIKSSIKETISKRREMALEYRRKVLEQLDEAEGKMASLSEVQVGLKDRVSRTNVISPVKGKVKTININTLGGVIKPGMDLVEIVPLEDNLLVEAKILPKDIAFLRPGLHAVVKLTAYDFAIYGGLSGTLEHISADTIMDEEGNSFYLIRVRTEQGNIGVGDSQLPIIPGMLASVDVMTGKKSVLDYLLKPILRAKQSALRER